MGDSWRTPYYPPPPSSAREAPVEPFNKTIDYTRQLQPPPFRADRPATLHRTLERSTIYHNVPPQAGVSTNRIHVSTFVNDVVPVQGDGANERYIKILEKENEDLKAQYSTM